MASYETRDVTKLGETFYKHVNELNRHKLTSEQIAAELAFRDQQIEKLESYIKLAGDLANSFQKDGKDRIEDFKDIQKKHHKLQDRQAKITALYHKRGEKIVEQSKIINLKNDLMKKLREDLIEERKNNDKLNESIKQLSRDFFMMVEAGKIYYKTLIEIIEKDNSKTKTDLISYKSLRYVRALEKMILGENYE